MRCKTPREVACYRLWVDAAKGRTAFHLDDLARFQRKHKLSDRQVCKVLGDYVQENGGKLLSFKGYTVDSFEGSHG